jgi:putative hydrolase of the HAD superfamily
MITHLLFDLDNTLYSSRYGLEAGVSQRINDYLVEILGMRRDEVEKIRFQLTQDNIYGTVLEWLMTEKRFTDIEDYYSVINPEDEAESLPPNPELGDFLASIPLPKAVLTNSCMKHTERVLDKLGIRRHFCYVFDIRFNNYKGKPRPDAFLRSLDIMNAEPARTLFIDDYPRFVKGFLALGGKALLMDEFNTHIDEVDSPSGLPLKRIKNIQEISRFI